MKPKKKKSICKWSRSEIEEALPLLIAEARAANYVCKKCGRSAETRSLLCKPVAEKKFK